jgi:hypothetical protein
MLGFACARASPPFPVLRFRRCPANSGHAGEPSPLAPKNQSVTAMGNIYYRSQIFKKKSCHLVFLTLRAEEYVFGTIRRPPKGRTQTAGPIASQSGVLPSSPCISTSAPLNTSSSMTSSWRFRTAPCKGVLPRLPCAFTSAPLDTSSSATSVCPALAASCSGVLAFTFFALTSAPLNQQCNYILVSVVGRLV